MKIIPFLGKNLNRGSRRVSTIGTCRNASWIDLDEGRFLGIKTLLKNITSTTHKRKGLQGKVSEFFLLDIFKTAF